MAAIRAGAAALLIVLSAAAAAADCVSDARSVSTRESVPNLITGPSAWSGLLLAVAKTEAGAPNVIWLALYSEELDTLVGDRRIVTDAAPNGIIALLWNGIEFHLFYRSAAERIHLQRLTPFGETIGGPVVINPSRRVRAGDELEAVWSTALNTTVVVQHIPSGTSRGIYVTLVEGNGVQRAEQRLVAVAENTSDFAVAVTDSGTIGIFFVAEDDGKLWLASIPPSGVFPDIRTTGLTSAVFTAAAQGELFAVVRLVEEEDEPARIHWFVIDANHEIVREDEELIEAGEGETLLPMSLIAGEGELALVYEEASRLRLRRFTISGTHVSDAPFSIRAAASAAVSDFPPVWTGTSYIIAPVRELSLTSYLVRYCPLRAEIAAPAVIRPGQTVLLVGTASGGTAPYDFVWTISRDPGGSRRQEAIQRTFPTTGTHTLTLQVTDADGSTTTSTVTIQVSDDAPPPPPPPSRRRSVRH